MTPPSPSMIAAMRQHIETAGVRVDRRKLDRALAAAWRAADRVRVEEANQRGFAGMNTFDTMPEEYRERFIAAWRRLHGGPQCAEKKEDSP